VETKIFTLVEANAMLPQLSEDLRQLQRLIVMLEERSRELNKRKGEAKPPDAGAGNDADPFFELETSIEFMRMEAELLVGNFARKGVLLKMIDPGLIDFPAVVDGQSVLICWKQGEERITHYHGWEEGFIGRKRHPEA